MSIDWLQDLEREIDNGREWYACPGTGRNQWVIVQEKSELDRLAKRSANQRKLPVNIVRLISRHDAVAGDLFLVPTKIKEPGPRNEPQVDFTTVETKEASEMMRDLRFGPAPYFAMQVEEEVQPDGESES